MKTALAALIVGYGLDLLLGDPSFLYHPIRVIGNLIALLEKLDCGRYFRKRQRESLPEEFFS